MSVWRDGGDVIGVHLGSGRKMNRMEDGPGESLSGGWFCGALELCDGPVPGKSEKKGRGLILYLWMTLICGLGLDQFDQNKTLDEVEVAEQGGWSEGQCDPE